MPASTSSPAPGRRPAAQPCSLALHGLGSAASLLLEGDRRDVLHSALLEAWSRCLAPQGAEQPAESITLRLETHGRAHADGVPSDGTGGQALVADRLDDLLQQTTQSVTRAFIAAQTGRLLMLHAGACADPVTGAAVVYVAPGGTGKTTLSRVLGRSLGYLTDETVGITADGRIRPYPKPLSIRQQEQWGAKIETSPDTLELVAAPSAPWLRRIVLLDRHDDHDGHPELTELDLADAIIALAPETSALSSLDRPLHLVAALVENTGPVLRCSYREAVDLAPALTALLEQA